MATAQAGEIINEPVRIIRANRKPPEENSFQDRPAFILTHVALAEATNLILAMIQNIANNEEQERLSVNAH